MNVQNVQSQLGEYLKKLINLFLVCLTRRKLKKPSIPPDFDPFVKKLNFVQKNPKKFQQVEPKK